MPNVNCGQLSSFCYAETRELYLNHGNEVGSEFRGDRRNRAITNCIIYVYKVLIDGYTRLGRNDVAASSQAMFQRQDGMELARYLVGQGWKAHYWNPDVYKPRDNQSEHVVRFKNAVNSRQYYTAPLSGLIVGYNKQEKIKTEHRGWFWPFGEDVSVSTEDPENLSVFEDLKRVMLSVGVNRGGTHCFLLSYGQVFEVHWDQEGPGLYSRRDFYGYGWNSGLLLTPPDSSFTSRSIDAVKSKMN